MELVNRQAIVAAAKAAGLPKENIAAMLAAAEAKTATDKTPRVLLTQAQKAKQLNVSRFTVRKLVAAGKLTPVELLPGLLRYRADELV